MSRIVRLHEPPQPVLPLGPGPVHWDTLPRAVRERVLALWMQLLTEHRARAEECAPRAPTAVALPSGSRAEGRP